jgi:hypothetical protein
MIHERVTFRDLMQGQRLADDLEHGLARVQGSLDKHIQVHGELSRRHKAVLICR